MFDERITLKVGAVAMFLVAAAAVAVLTFDGLELGPGLRVEVFMSHAGNLQEGADVQIAGRQIGRVKTIQLVPERLATAADHPLHGTGGVMLVLRVEASRADWTALNGEFFIGSKGLLGEPYLEIGPPPPDATRGRPLEDGDQVRGVDPVRLDRVMARSLQNLAETRIFLADVAPAGRELVAAVSELSATLREIEPTPGTYARLADSFGALGDEIEALGKSLDQSGFDSDSFSALVARAGAFATLAERDLGELGAGIEALSADIRRIKGRLPPDLFARFELAIERGRDAVARAQDSLATAQALVRAMQSGEGTIGALLNDPEFSDDAKKLGRIIKRQPWRVVAPPQSR